MKYALIALGVIVLVAAAFWGGTVYAGVTAPQGAGGPAGAFASLYQEERQQLRSMTTEQRDEFLAEKGIEAPSGAFGNGVGRPGNDSNRPNARGTRLLEGSIASAADKEISVALDGGGSVAVFVDDKTVEAIVAGTDGSLEKGTKVMVFAEPEADGVLYARAIVLK